MSSSEEAIKRVVEAFERSNWAEIDVRTGELRVHLAASAPSDGSTPGRSDATGTSDDTPSAEPAHAAVGPAPTLAAHASADAARVSPTLDELSPGTQVVLSPSPGIFWRSPEPGLPPFAETGQTVTPADTVCIVEVMKLMNHVKAGVAGVVVAVYGDNGVAVHKDQALFAIAPEGGSG